MKLTDYELDQTASFGCILSKHHNLGVFFANNNNNNEKGFIIPDGVMAGYEAIEAFDARGELLDS